MTAAENKATADRQHRLGVLARASRETLEAAVASLAPLPGLRHLKAPETGLALVRARAGGNGQAFNFGEMTVTRCVVALEGEAGIGVGYVAGRDRRKAELLALLDALAQQPDRAARLDAEHIAPEARRQQAARVARASKVAATKVDFFTLVRGED